MTPPMTASIDAPVILYRRVSTDEQAKSGLGLDDQKARLEAFALAKGWEHTIDIVDDGYSASRMKRPGLDQALAMLADGSASGILTLKLDRLTRSVRDLNSLVEQSQQQGWGFTTVDDGIDTTSAGGRMVANVIASIAQWELEVISERTRAALAAKRSRGERVGGQIHLAQETRRRIYNARQRGESYGRIATALQEDGVLTARGNKTWHRSTIVQVLRSIENERDLLAKTGTDLDPSIAQRFIEAFGPIE